MFGKTHSPDGYAGYFEGGRNYFEGNLGIGTNDPLALLHVGTGDEAEIRLGLNPQLLLARNVANNKFRIQLTGTGFGGQVLQIGRDDEQHNVALMGNVGVGTGSPGFKLEVNGSAGKPGGGSWSNSSDQRLKKNINDLEGSLDKLLALRGVTFEYKDPDAINELRGERIGMIAQEVEQIFPDWVAIGGHGYKTLTFRGFEALTVEALRELRAEKDAQIASLRADKDAQIEALQARLAVLEQNIGKTGPSARASTLGMVTSAIAALCLLGFLAMGRNRHCVPTRHAI